MKAKFLKWLKDLRNPMIAVAVIIIIILSLLLQCRKSGKCPEQKTDTVKTTEVIYDSIPVKSDIPKPEIKWDTLRIPLYMDVDTLAIILAYFTENYYDLVLKDDTSAYVRYCVSVWQNELAPGKFEFKNRRPTTINNTTIVNNIIQERKFKMFLGGSVGGSMNSFNLNAGVLVQYKSFLTGANYGFMDKSINIPLYMKLSFGKKKK
jgi:hypothetical protein